jgi:hypothetical protein
MIPRRDDVNWLKHTLWYRGNRLSTSPSTEAAIRRVVSPRHALVTAASRSGATELKFRIYRYDPERDEKPRLQDYDAALDPDDRMLLDALIRLKTVDDTLSFRRSCREGVCGSDAMNINGKNGLACITNLKTLKEPVELRPLPGLPVIRDLIVDMSQFFAIPFDPYLHQRHAAAGEGAALSGRARARRVCEGIRAGSDAAVVLVESRRVRRPADAAYGSSPPAATAISTRLDNPSVRIGCSGVARSELYDVCPKNSTRRWRSAR